MRSLAALCTRARRHDDVSVVATLSRATLSAAEAAGHASALRDFGATLVTDTCWCMLGEPLVPRGGALMTNSAKYAHYGPGLVGRRVRFASLENCVEAAVTGRVPSRASVTLRYSAAAASLLQFTSLQKFHAHTEGCDRSRATSAAMSARSSASVSGL